MDTDAYFKGGEYANNEFKIDDSSGGSYHKDIEEIYSCFSNDGKVILKRRINYSHCWGSDFSDEGMDRDSTYLGTYQIVSKSEDSNPIWIINLSLKSVFTTGKDHYIGSDPFRVTPFHESQDNLNLNVRVKLQTYPKKLLFINSKSGGQNPITTRQELVENE